MLGQGCSSRFAAALVLALLPAAPARPVPCSTVRVAPGTEDFVLDRSAGVPRLIVSTQRRPGREQGALWALPLGRDGPGPPYPLALEGRTPDEPFHPLGLDIGPGPAGKPLLYAISRGEDAGGQIEVFEVDGRVLRRQGLPLRSDIHLISPNDLAVAPDRELYVTNDRGSSGWVGMLEQVLGLARSQLVSYREGRWRVAASAIGFANGVAVSPDGTAVYVAGLRDGGIHLYRRRGGI